MIGWRIFIVLLAIHPIESNICSHPNCQCDGFVVVRCGCRQAHEEITLTSEGEYELAPSITSLIIRDCSRVYVTGRSFKDLLQLRSIRIFNVETLFLSQNSFEWQNDNHFGLEIHIENTTIPEIPSYSFKGSIKSLNFKSINVPLIHANVIIGRMHVEHFEISDSVFGQVTTHTFKRFNVDKIILVNNTFRELPSRTFSDVNVTELTFRKNRALHLRSSFIKADHVRQLIFSDNIIGTMDGECLVISNVGDVFITNNVIEELKPGAFLGLSVRGDIKDRYGVKSLYLKNNTVSQFRGDSFSFDRNSYRLISANLMLNQPCDCQTFESIYNTIDVSSLNCNYNYRKYPLQTYKEDYCTYNRTNTAVMIVGIVSGIVFVLIIIFGGIFIYKYRKRKTIMNNVVKPDGKTYKETELYVVVEKADLLTTDL